MLDIYHVICAGHRIINECWEKIRIKTMAQKLDPKEVVPLEELANSNYFQIETMLRLLLKKGIITKQDYIDEMKELREDMAAQGEDE